MQSSHTLSQAGSFALRDPTNESAIAWPTDSINHCHPESKRTIKVIAAILDLAVPIFALQHKASNDRLSVQKDPSEAAQAMLQEVAHWRELLMGIELCEHSCADCQEH